MNWTCTQFEREIFEYPLSSTDLAPRDYHLFLHLKKCLAGQGLRSAQETKDIVQECLKSLTVTFITKGIQKLVP